jgi:hypothetical protein
MDISNVNLAAVVVAALASFLVGGLWYSKALFGNVWMRESGLTEEKIKQRSMLMIFSTTFLLALVIAFNLAAFLAGPPNLLRGLTTGGLVGLGWVAASMGITYLFEMRSANLFFINAGYHVVTFIVMGAILGIWK